MSGGSYSGTTGDRRNEIVMNIVEAIMLGVEARWFPIGSRNSPPPANEKDNDNRRLLEIKYGPPNYSISGRQSNVRLPYETMTLPFPEETFQRPI